MALQRSTVAFQTLRNLRKIDGEIQLRFRSRTTTSSGAILPEPKRTRFGLLFVVFNIVSVGLVTGTTLSKMMADFFEEKELFIPSDDDDDDD